MRDDDMARALFPGRKEGVGTSIQPDRNTPAHPHPPTKPHVTGLPNNFAGALEHDQIIKHTVKDQHTPK